jgi:hypothetical protein
MADHFLVVSNPPHGDIQPQAASQVLGCVAADIRIKANYAGPEIWLADPDKESARSKATELVQSGVNVVLIPGCVLAAVPPLQRADAVQLKPDRLVVTTGGSTLALEGGAPAVAVVGRSPKQEARRSSQAHVAPAGAEHAPSPAHQEAGPGVSISTGPEDSVFLDLYAHTAGGWMAVRFASAEVDFSGLGDKMQPSAQQNVWSVIESFEQCSVDERLMGVVFRRSMVAGKAVHLLLHEIDEDLGLLPPVDLASRLAFLTSKGRLAKQ